MGEWVSRHESVVVEPAASAWRLRERAGGLDPDATAFRRQLGLPVGRPVVMSGHQAGFWHAGIVAKVYALLAAAERFGAAPAWVVVDQDVGEPGRVPAPVRRAGRSGEATRLARAWVDVLPPVAAGIVTGRQAAALPRAVDVEAAALPTVAEGLGRMSGALRERAGAASRAMQVSGAAMDLAGAGTGANSLVSALSLARTDLFSGLVERMRKDPDGCVNRYNAAARAHPEARVRQLAGRGPRGAELPLWLIDEHGRRAAACVDDVGASGVTLAPRALTMTALLRWGGCDLFIHGLGGGVYDPIMEAWLGSWLGVRDLAPAVVVSATRFLPLASEPPPTPEIVARAAWALQHARHDPALAGALLASLDGGAGRASIEPSAEKRRLTHAIRNAEGGGRFEAYRALHRWLDEQRLTQAPALAALESRADEIGSRAGTSGVVFDRTWPAALLGDGAMSALEREVRRRVMGGM